MKEVLKTLIALFLLFKIAGFFGGGVFVEYQKIEETPTQNSVRLN